jgi:hypothetical protein
MRSHALSKSNSACMQCSTVALIASTACATLRSRYLCEQSDISLHVHTLSPLGHTSTAIFWLYNAVPLLLPLTHTAVSLQLPLLEVQVAAIMSLTRKQFAISHVCWSHNHEAIEAALRENYLEGDRTWREAFDYTWTHFPLDTSYSIGSSFGSSFGYSGHRRRGVCFQWQSDGYCR